VPLKRSPAEERPIPVKIPKDFPTSSEHLRSRSPKTKNPGRPEGDIAESLFGSGGGRPYQGGKTSPSFLLGEADEAVKLKK